MTIFWRHFSSIFSNPLIAPPLGSLVVLEKWLGATVVVWVRALGSTRNFSRSLVRAVPNSRHFQRRNPSNGFVNNLCWANTCILGQLCSQNLCIMDQRSKVKRDNELVRSLDYTYLKHKILEGFFYEMGYPWHLILEFNNFMCSSNLSFEVKPLLNRPRFPGLIKILFWNGRHDIPRQRAMVFTIIIIP